MPTGAREKLWLGGVLLLGLVGVVVAFVSFGPGGQRMASPSRPDVGTGGDLNALLHAADPSRGADLFGRCAACHSIGRGAVDLDGPNLYGVVGRPVAGRRPRYAYTAALRRFGGIWSFDRLDAWLRDPSVLVPHTRMVFEGVSDPRDRADVIAYLNSQGSNLPLP